VPLRWPAAGACSTRRRSGAGRQESSGNLRSSCPCCDVESRRCWPDSHWAADGRLNLAFYRGRVVGVLFENSDHDVLYVAVLMQQFVYVRCGRVDAFVAAQVAAI
jgi:hypothetical protein